MEIIQYRNESLRSKEKLMAQMKNCDWDAGQWLCSILAEESEEKIFGKGTKILMLTDKEKLVSFCTLAPRDEIDDPSMTPWIGFVYTFPEYRGNRCSGILISKAKELASAEGHKKIYVSSEEVGLYEKYGFSFIEHRRSVHGYITGIFECDLK